MSTRGELSRREFLQATALATGSALLTMNTGYSNSNNLTRYAQSTKRPNILWLSCEDISPRLGCYGDSVARTPNLDRLAKQGMRFINVFTSAPVCAPCRSGIINVWCEFSEIVGWAAPHPTIGWILLDFTLMNTKAQP